MVKKLSDDHLRIILDIEAKGVQAELQKITSETVRLTNVNKALGDSLKQREKDLASSEKALKKLENAEIRAGTLFF